MQFSFLMCVNQDQPFLDQAVSSMIAQDYKDEYEIIIVANNCLDALYEKLQGYAERSKNIRLFRTSIGQLAFNLNYGFDQAKGDYVVRMDADDVCFPDRLTRTAEMLEVHEYPDVLSGLAQKVDESGRVTQGAEKVPARKNVSRLLWFKNPIVHPATAIKRESLLKARGYLGGVNCEDYDLWLRMDRLGMDLIQADFLAIQYRINPYQVKGSRIAYADGVGLKLREALFRPSLLFFIGTLQGLTKFLIFSLMRRMK